MRAILITQFGGPEVLQVGEAPRPTPQEYDLLVEVHASALNPVDYKICKGAFREGRALPFIPGYDVSGVVREMGSRVEGFQPGDAVYASPSLVRQGANAEFVCVDARTAALKPAALDHIQAAALPLVTLTAWEALLVRARVQESETVLIHAGGGGVGHVAIQLAKWRGARVLATASREESKTLCRQLGADLVIDHAREDFVQRVQEATDGRGCPVVLDAVGGETFDRSLDCVAVDGRMITVVGSPSQAIPRKLFVKNATLYFEFVGTPTVHGVRLGSQGELLRAAAQLAQEGQLKPHVSRVLGWEEVAEGHRLLQDGHVTGKLVVQIK